MKNILLLIIIIILITMPVFAYEIHYIKNNKGHTGYTKTYSNGKTVQYNKKGQVEYTYKKDSSGKVTKYSKTGRKLETYK
ncbi:MAG: hypothetical protein BHW64_00545 [Candidatus Melainabacteria bacterium LEY3_CP_29_8]|nr:MAG: hypothetical protein BHW64_00545 [Candidatus Melainabacteria bacterium LEY3_CP_29_8]